MSMKTKITKTILPAIAVAIMMMPSTQAQARDKHDYERYDRSDIKRECREHFSGSIGGVSGTVCFERDGDIKLIVPTNDIDRARFGYGHIHTGSNIRSHGHKQQIVIYKYKDDYNKHGATKIIRYAPGYDVVYRYAGKDRDDDRRYNKGKVVYLNGVPYVPASYRHDDDNDHQGNHRDDHDHDNDSGFYAVQKPLQLNGWTFRWQG